MKGMRRNLLTTVLTVMIGMGVMFVFFACGSGGGGGGGGNGGGGNGGPTGPLMIAADLNGDIVSVDKQDGSTKPLLDVYNAVTFDDIGPVSGMVYDPDTQFIYAATKDGNGFGGGTCSGCIYKIDPKTGEAFLALDWSSNTGHIYDIALHNGLLFFTSEESAGALYTVMPTYGTSALAAPSLLTSSSYDYWGSGLFFDQNDNLYVEGFFMIAVNASTGDERFLDFARYPDTAPFEAIYPGFLNSIHWLAEQHLSAAVDPDSMTQYVLLQVNSSDTEPWYLTTLNAPDTDVTFAAATDRAIDGLAFVPEGVITSNLGQAPQPPSSVEAVNAYQSVLIGWEPVFGASSYQIYWSASPGVTPSTYDGVTTVNGKTHYADKDAVGTTYYVVTAVRSGQESEASDEVSAAPNTDTGVELISFAPDILTAGSTAIANLVDDSLTGPINIGFDFNFFGNIYTQFKMSSNGFISFDAGLSDNGCCAGRDLLADSINDIVAFAWGDLYPEGGGTIKYEAIGTQPNRRLVIDIVQDYYQEFGNNLVRAQVILYEGPTGTVEIHSERVGEFSVLTQGVEDETGSTAYYVPGRVANRFGLTNEAARFITNSVL